MGDEVVRFSGLLQEHRKHDVMGNEEVGPSGSLQEHIKEGEEAINDRGLVLVRYINHGLVRYIKHNVQDKVFELPEKYIPPFTVIGKGAYGMVCSAMDSERQIRVAIKKIENAFQNGLRAKLTYREVKLNAHLSGHENIIGIRDIIRSPQREKFNDVYIVSELMETDLHQVLSLHEPLTEWHQVYILYQLLRGLKYIHSANVLHRDLKPSNLLVSSDCTLKICDFGLARINSPRALMNTEVVTFWYRAPELLLGYPRYTYSVDIWSVGCIFMELVTGKHLFPGANSTDQLQLICKLLGSPDESSLWFLQTDEARRRYVRQILHFPKHQLSQRFPAIPPIAIDLVEKMLVFDPNKRITCDEALAHPYLEKLHDISDEPTCTSPLSADFGDLPLTIEDFKELVWEESLKFSPDLKP